MDKKGLFDVRIKVTHPDPETESQVVKAIASEFLRMGVKAVVVIADDEQINYVNDEVYNVTTGDLFRSNPVAPVELQVLGHKLSSLN